MISVKNAGVSFEQIEVLKNINFEVPEQEILTVLGKNGSGKTVLLKTVAGLVNCTAGEVMIEGKPAESKMYYRPGASLISYVFQIGGLFDSMTVYENIAFGMRRKKHKENYIEEKINQALEDVGLSGNADKLPSELSGGMQKRVGLARAICMDPKIILYDDPTAGLDPVLTDQIADLLMKIREKFSVTSIVVTHDLRFAKKISDNIMLLYGAEAVFYGNKNDFFSKNNAYARQFIDGDIEGPIDIY